MSIKPEQQRAVVLVVDDDPSSLGLLCDTLEAEGYTVLVARDGKSALERLEIVVPDAILLDAVMPGLSGFDACRQIKSNPSLAHVPVIFMTGLTETPHVLEGFASGGVDYVVKPLRVQEVIVRLHTHTRNARIARLARDAVDVAGLGVLLVDAKGRIAWISPTAALWLKIPDITANEGRVPEQLYAALTTTTDQILLSTTGARLSVKNMGQVGIGETMLLLEQHSTIGTNKSRLADAALTPRETEVLAWLAKGKTNRDIGDILGVSHRTVNKHLENVFEKLGVETRAAATALAVSYSVNGFPETLTSDNAES